MEVYANYASAIVSLLDIHPAPFQDIAGSNECLHPSLEILEAGTGHGSLTLHVARAIACANPPLLPAPTPHLKCSNRKPKEPVALDETQLHLVQAWSEWKQKRKAILHTVENVTRHSYHAENVVRGFRQGMYWPHVDFHVGDMKNWIYEQLKLRRERTWNTLHARDGGDEFLSYVLLDMPGVQKQLKHVHHAMRNGAKLLVFAPSVTQIADCVRVIREGTLPLTLENVIEVGEGISTGRKWDVRMVMKRKPMDKASGENMTSAPTPEADLETMEQTASHDGLEGESYDSTTLPLSSTHDDAPPDEGDAEVEDGPVMICRPRVGERTLGGGFVALWRKASTELDDQWKSGLTGYAKKRHR